VHSKEGSNYAVQLNIYPSSINADGSARRPKVVDNGKNEVGATDALSALLHSVNPTRVEYRNER
jgi:hypothetical protein